ncbi:MAG: CBS domain-containing protein, partial [Gammaproteobacteria bacterium]|nr:CBS domain-containing protein [Gammaproteobacteria bacterium]
EKSDLLKLIEDVYFIPEGALLHQQLSNFQRKNQRIGLVVDEYGAIQGLLTLKDLLEEIVGDFSVSSVELEKLIEQQADGSLLVDASINIRDLNRLAHWHFPILGPRTLSGLIIEYLESIPKAGICVQIADYRIEVLSVSRNRIQQVRVVK